MALTGPLQTTKIDANRSAVFRNGFEKKKQKHNQIFSHIFAHQNSSVSRASNPRLRLVSDFQPSCQRSCDNSAFFNYIKTVFLFFGTNHKIELVFFLCSSTMDQRGSSLGLTPVARCHTDNLPLMNSVHAFQMIPYLLFRTLPVLLCSSREVSSSGLYGRRSSAQSRYFLIINIHNIAAKVRAVELAGEKSCDPSGILAMKTLPWPQRTPKFYSSRAQRAFIGPFRM